MKQLTLLFSLIESKVPNSDRAFGRKVIIDRLAAHDAKRDGKLFFQNSLIQYLAWKTGNVTMTEEDEEEE